MPLVAAVSYIVIHESRHGRERMTAQARAAAASAAARLADRVGELSTLLSALAAQPVIRSLDRAACEPALAGYARVNPALARLAVVDASGRTVCGPSAEGLSEGRALAPAFEAARRSGPILAGDATTLPGTRLWVQWLAVPVPGARDEAAGLLVLPFELGRLASALGAPTADVTIVAVLDDSGRVMARSRDSARWVGRAVPPAIRDAMMGGGESFEGVDPEGLPRLFTSAGVPGTRWTVVAGIEAQALESAESSTLLATASGGLALILVALGIAFAMGRAIAAPIEDLAQAAGRFAAGDAGARAVPSGPAELRQVATQFNRMLDAIERHPAEIAAVGASAGRWRERAHDITARRRAEAELRHSEARFRGLLEASPNISVQGYDRNRRAIYWNPACESMYGFTREEALGRRMEDLVIPEAMRRDIVRAFGLWLEHGQPMPCGELTLRHRDGHPVHVFASHVSLPNTAGEPEMFCISVDLGALDRARSEADAWRSRYQAAIVASGQLLHEWNPASGELTILGDTERILGYGPGELDGGLARWRELIHPDDLAEFEGHLGESIRESRPFHHCYRVRRADGAWLDMQDDGFFVRDEAGAVSRMVCFVRDISTEVRHRDEIDRQLEELRRWHEAMLGRESRILELKAEVNALLAATGSPQRYGSARSEATPA